MALLNNATNNQPSSIGSFLLVPNNFCSKTASGQQSFVLSDNVVRCFPIFLSTKIVVAKVAFEVVTLSVGSLAAIGIYSADGNTLLINSGAVSTTTAGVKTVTLGSPVTLAPGKYIYAVTANNTTPTSYAALTGSFNVLLNAFTTTAGTAANASASGVLPSTTGVITTSSQTMVFALLSAE